jgi:hypothetical protein
MGRGGEGEAGLAEAWPDSETGQGGEGEAGPAGAEKERPGQPGRAAAGKPGWAGRDGAEAGPPGRRCPGLAPDFHYNQAGIVISRPSLL